MAQIIGLQSRSCLNPDSDEWKLIERKFKLSVPTVKISQIEVNQSKAHLSRYYLERELMQTKLGHQPLEMQLWHGTSHTPPSRILKSDQGLDICYSSGGLWGRALYFAEQASYSVPNFSYKVPGTPCQQVFLVDVLLGKSVTLPMSCHIIKPPLPFDSVNGKALGQPIHMVY